MFIAICCISSRDARCASGRPDGFHCIMRSTVIGTAGAVGALREVIKAAASPLNRVATEGAEANK